MLNFAPCGMTYVNVLVLGVHIFLNGVASNLSPWSFWLFLYILCQCLSG